VTGLPVFVPGPTTRVQMLSRHCGVAGALLLAYDKAETDSQSVVFEGSIDLGHTSLATVLIDETSRSMLLVATAP
jgi:hypothetical protein